MVSLVVEAVGRALIVARLARSRRGGAAVQPPRPAAPAPCARALRPMQAPMSVEPSGQPVGQSVDHSAGTAAAGMGIGARLLGSPVPPLRQDCPHRRRPRLRCGPGAKGGHAGGNRGGGGRALPRPHRLRQRQSRAAAVAALQEAGPAAQEHRQRRQQPLPGMVGRFPAVGVDGLGSVWRIDWAGFRRARARGGAQRRVGGRLGPGDPPHTARARREGAGGLCAAPSGVMCVGREMLGPRLRVAPGASHEAMSAAPFDLPLPGGRLVSAGLGPQPRGHALGEQSQRGRDVFRETSHGRHDAAGPQRGPLTALQPQVPPAKARQLGRLAQAAGQSIALRYLGGKECRGTRRRCVDHGAHRLRVAPALLVRLTSHRQAHLRGTLLGLPMVGVSSPTTAPRSLHSVHAGALLLEQRKEATGWRGQLARLFPWT